MENLLYLIKILYKKRWLLLAVPFAVALIVYVILSSQPSMYKSETTIYTGIISGYNASTTGERQDWSAVNNALENLISIVLAESTLENVYLKLLARNLVNLDGNKDNEVLTAKSSRSLIVNLPADVFRLVEAGDEQSTYENLKAFYDKDRTNCLKQLFLWDDPVYSYKALSKVSVSRIGASDMLRLSYENSDPFIVCNTLKILVEEFVRQYFNLRYEQTDDVLKYFEEELARIHAELTLKEDDLMDYNVRNQIINYEEQTKMVAERSRNIESELENANRKLESARKKKELLEEKLGATAELYKNNAEFINKINEISDAYASSVVLDTLSADSGINQIKAGTEDLRKISIDIMSSKYSKEGMSLDLMTEEWLEAVIDETISEAELIVLRRGYEDNLNAIRRFSPVGTSLSRQNREIEFSESNYRENLHAFNEAKLKRKNLQLSSATFKTLTPPTAAFVPEKTKNNLYTAVAFILVFILLTAVEVFSEIFNKKPYDKSTAEKLIGTPTLGAFPDLSRETGYNDVYAEFSTSQLGNALINHFDRTKSNNIVNVISVNQGDGKSRLCDELMSFFQKLDTNPVLVSWHKDFDYDSKYYVMAGSIYDFAMNEDNMETLPKAEVILVEYPPLSISTLPLKPLANAAVNLIVVNSLEEWSEMDQIMLRRLKEYGKNSEKVFLCLNYADIDAVGAFTGLLPPFTQRHKLRFKFWNLGNKDNA